MQNEKTHPGDNIWLDARIPTLQFHGIAGQPMTVRHVYQRDVYLGKLTLTATKPDATIEHFVLVHATGTFYCHWESATTRSVAVLRELIILVPRVFDGARTVLKLTYHHKPQEA